MLQALNDIGVIAEVHPKRCIWGEVRSKKDATAWIKAIAVGHDGKMATMHAGIPTKKGRGKCRE